VRRSRGPRGHRRVKHPKGMGNYGSSRIIGYAEAQQLLGPVLTRRLEEGFHRLVVPAVGAPGGGRAPSNPQIDRKTFQRYILDAFPLMVSQWGSIIMCIHGECTPGGGGLKKGR
jgi:hypothetical protein